MKARLRGFLVGLILLIGSGAFVAFLPPGGPRTLTRFDADRTASLEIGMWQAYYDKEKFDLFRLLTIQLREQYRYTWARAVRAGFHLAKAAATFGDLRGDYDQVLPDLESAFELARSWTRSDFDPAAVARAELAWWVARRTAGENSPEQVGERIAEAYALLYGVPVAQVARAGLLRAQAAALRDAGGRNADWPAVSTLLHESYRDLHAALQP
jgi:hypothetical protein